MVGGDLGRATGGVSPREAGGRVRTGMPLAFFFLSRGETPRTPRFRLGWQAAGKAQGQSCEKPGSDISGLPLIEYGSAPFVVCDLAYVKLAPRLQIALREGL